MDVLRPTPYPSTMTRSSLIRLALVLGATALATVVAGASAATAPFNPTAFAGSWLGTWTNLTFNTTGPASIVATAPGGTRLNFTTDFGGNVFGCSDPPAATDGIPKGTGPNSWDEAGFRLSQTTEAFGSTTLTYDHLAGTLKGGGTNPTCLNGLTWQLDGTFTGNTFEGTIAISLPGGASATSKLSMTRTPEPDTTAPTVITQGFIGRRSAAVPLRWRAQDLNGQATFLVTVSAIAKPGATPARPLFTRTLRAQTIGIDKLSAHRLAWPAQASKGVWFRLCVTATDTAKNASKPTCANLKLS